MPQATNDRYELIEVLPSSVGDFETASYKARERVSDSADIPSGRVVLLRALPSVPNPEVFYVATNAARSLGRNVNILDTYGIVNLEGDGPIPAALYSVTEYARGITLRERIRRVAPFSLAVTIDVAVSVTQALVFADDQSISHGHLVAEEVLLTPEGQVKVADFALGSAIAQAQGKIFTSSSDVRSVGVLLYEMLTGQTPAVGGSGDALSPRIVNANVPPALDGITRKALATDSRLQYNLPAALLADLQAARDDLRTGKPLTWTPAASQPVRSATKAPAPGLLTQAATEIAQEEKQKVRQRVVEEDQERAGSPLLGRFVMVLFVIGILGIIGVAILFATMLTVPADTTVPNLIGKTLTDAQTLAKSDHFNLVVESHDYNDTWPENTVYAQDVPADREIKSGKDVNVKVSDGPPLSTVPDLSQVTLSRAKEMIEAAGLPVGTVTEEYNDVVPKGIVTDQSPSAASMISHLAPVNVTVSKGPSPPSSPVGLTASATIQGEIDLSWNEVTNASSYNVYRDGTKIATGIIDPSFADAHLGPSESHNYTLTAVNVNGESAQCTAVSATTLDQNGTPPQSAPAPVSPGAPPSAVDQTVPADNTNAPDNSVAPPVVATAPRPRQFHIRFRVPEQGDAHQVQIQVQDATGTNTVYDESRPAGRIIDEDYSAFGNKVIIRIYIDGVLVKQQTK